MIFALRSWFVFVGDASAARGRDVQPEAGSPATSQDLVSKISVDQSRSGQLPGTRCDLISLSREEPGVRQQAATWAPAGPSELSEKSN